MIHHESYENHIFREQQGFCTNEPMAWVAGSNPLYIHRLYEITAKRGTSGETIFENQLVGLQGFRSLSNAELRKRSY